MPDAAFRHPWHPVLVHFPIACWIGAAMLDVLAASPVTLRIPGVEGSALSHLLLWAGSVLALPTIAAGLYDLLRLPRSLRGSAALAHHILWMGSAWTIFLLAGVFRLRSGLFASPAGWPVLLAEVAGAVCLIFGGRAAARLVFAELASARAEASTGTR